jgi:ATP-dependent Clp protease adaptor protein ClpS
MRDVAASEGETVDPAGGTAVVERPLEEVTELPAAQTPWVTIVWDDPVNLMSYVTHVFVTYFHYPKAKAQRLMLEVHNDGKAIVSSGSREEMERDVTAMHEFGLWATLDKAEQ